MVVNLKQEHELTVPGWNSVFCRHQIEVESNIRRISVFSLYNVGTAASTSGGSSALVSSDISSATGSTCVRYRTHGGSCLTSLSPKSSI